MACYQITINDNDGLIFYKVCLLSVLLAVSSIIDHQQPCPALPQLPTSLTLLELWTNAFQRYVTLRSVECHEAVAVLTFTMVEKYLGMCC